MFGNFAEQKLYHSISLPATNYFWIIQSGDLAKEKYKWRNLFILSFWCIQSGLDQVKLDLTALPREQKKTHLNKLHNFPQQTQLYNDNTLSLLLLYPILWPASLNPLTLPASDGHSQSVFNLHPCSANQVTMPVTRARLSGLAWRKGETSLLAAGESQHTAPTNRQSRSSQARLETSWLQLPDHSDGRCIRRYIGIFRNLLKLGGENGSDV